MQCEVKVVTEGTVDDWRNFGVFAGDVFFGTAKESEYTSTKDVAHALEIRNVLAECHMTLRMKGTTDGTAGRATAARRGVGSVHHLDAAVVGRRRGSLVSSFEPAWRT